MQKWFLGCWLLLGAVAVRCQSVPAVQRIEYISMTRGYEKRVVMTPDSLYHQVQGRGTAVDEKGLLPKGGWAQLKDAYTGVKPAELPSLPSPTMKRAYDGAMHSSITLYTSDGQAYTHSFDDEDPNDQLKKLMRAIAALTPKE